MIERILPGQANGVQPAPARQDSPVNPESSFADALAIAEQGVKFSNHAQKRMQVRDINLSDDGISRLNRAVEKAEKRGCRESLVLMDDLAFIVNVKERMIVTAMDVEQKGEGVFTSIDSVVLADDE